ncbi:TetR/AcrR family transcriptional regulator [Streptomyces sp. Lzd4kr]|nr:TetR/AcrR family transcriptional regulator [Streptomyces sp. Lzd4kr]
MAAQVRSPRERYREQTRNEIKEAAVRQLAVGGVESVALLRIAKEMGMSGPALYRYFASRDDLLAEMVLDAYQAAGDAVQAVDNTQAGGRTALRNLAAGYHAWAVAHPHLYLLIQGTPVPGFTAPAETVQRARAVLGPFLPVFAEGRPLRTIDPLLAEFRDWLRQDEHVAAWVRQWTSLAADAPAAAVALTGSIMAWPVMHGTISLEAVGQFSDMGHRPTTLLDVQIAMLADVFQLA